MLTFFVYDSIMKSYFDCKKHDNQFFDIHMLQSFLCEFFDGQKFSLLHGVLWPIEKTNIYRYSGCHAKIGNFNAEKFDVPHIAPK